LCHTHLKGDYTNNMGKNILRTTLLTAVLCLTLSCSQAILTIDENFDTNPGWEGVNNRVECEDCPEITQDFGWTPGNHNGDGAGEISGTIWRSTTPAYYALPLGEELSFKDSHSASGKISVISTGSESYGFYFGFFGEERQGWRVWSSNGVRIAAMKNGKARFHLDYKTGAANGAILNPDLEIPGDGSVHTWELKYEPEISVADYEWPDDQIPGLFRGDYTNTHHDTLLARFKEIEPSMTTEKLRDLMFICRDRGLVDNWYRKGQYHLWNLEENIEEIKGKITFIFDGEAVSYFLIPGHQDMPTAIDRFGIWNMQIYTGSMEFHLSDLIINDQKVDLSEDPHWEGMNNRETFLERDFHSRHNYGYTQTNWAGETFGEIGGRFWGTEVSDPLHGYYATDIGKLTLDDPIKFSGVLSFVEGAVDGRMLLGYFNRQEKMAAIEGEYKGNPPHQFLGLEVMDKTKHGYNLAAVCSPRQDISFEHRGPVMIPDRVQKPFTFEYDPNAGIAGRITVTLAGDTFAKDLSKEQRNVGSEFDHFGLHNPRKGGKYVDVYIDDMKYSSRKIKEQVEQKKQGTVFVPYPPNGRLHK